MKELEELNPASPGYSMPAEWAPHQATWIGWPYNREDWPGKMGAVRWVYGEIARKILHGERLCILVQNPGHELQARRMLRHVGADLSRAQFFQFPTDRGWLRDSGPLFLRKKEPPGELAIARFRFYGWARYPDWEKDDIVPQHVAGALGIRLLPICLNGSGVVLEGGSIDVNGRGTILTTEECLLDQEVQVRNPGLGREQMEKVFASVLGASNVLWLGKGISGDDTHGHVDDLCRFVSPSTVVICQEEDPADTNYHALQENRERLEGMRLEDGSQIQVVPLPMPSPLYFRGQRLPASYANFYIANAAVLVPTFNDPRDRLALGILSELFTDRPVIGIHAVDLVWGLGTIHCLTREQPGGPAGNG